MFASVKINVWQSATGDDSQMSVEVERHDGQGTSIPAARVAAALGWLFDGYCATIKVRTYANFDLSGTGLVVTWAPRGEPVRSLVIHLPAIAEAFDGDAGVAVAEAKNWLISGKMRDEEFFVYAGHVVELQAALKNQRAPTEKNWRAVADQFGIPRDEAGAACVTCRTGFRNMKKLLSQIN